MLHTQTYLLHGCRPVRLRQTGVAAHLENAEQSSSFDLHTAATTLWDLNPAVHRQNLLLSPQFKRAHPPSTLHPGSPSGARAGEDVGVHKAGKGICLQIADLDRAPLTQNMLQDGQGTWSTSVDPTVKLQARWDHGAVLAPRETYPDGMPTPKSTGARSEVTSTADSLSTSTEPLDTPLCTAALPAGGFLSFNDSYILTLADTIAYTAPCTENGTIFDLNSTIEGNSTVIAIGDPFYASIAPQAYALAAATIISYMLLIMIFITPRTFYMGGPAGNSSVHGGATGFLSRRGVSLPGTLKNSGVIGIGRRPWLQKVAALTVSISLTIATADTFKEVERQYEAGYISAAYLVKSVTDSTEIRVTEIVSDAFVWLAQVQTLIRLFPRHREKVTIKWLGFGLVTLDTVFSILQAFVHDADGGSSLSSAELNAESSSDSSTGTFDFGYGPQGSHDAIPTLTYLFELAISLIYASCVVYYALSKRRLAFWHPKMRNICIVAFLSLISILVPVVFFILDVANPSIATWGEYIRWVGAAAASVVVWEWVERVEALERDERKDGILGREIFDGDEMLSDISSMGYDDYQPSFLDRGHDDQSRRNKKHGAWQSFKNLDFNLTGPLSKINVNIPLRKRKAARQKRRIADSTTTTHDISRPPQAVTPVSRSNTNSAASTVYAVRYHNPLSPSPAIHEEPGVVRAEQDDSNAPKESVEDSSTTSMDINSDKAAANQHPTSSHGIAPTSAGHHFWQSVSNPFKRKRAEPPAEVAAQISELNERRSPTASGLRRRVNAFTSAQRDRLVRRSSTASPLGVIEIPAQPRTSRAVGNTNDERAAPGVIEKQTRHQTMAKRVEQRNEDVEDNKATIPESLPVTVIPAPVRGQRTWSPADLQDDLISDSGQTAEDAAAPMNKTTSSELHSKTASRAAIPATAPTGTSPPARTTPSPAKPNLVSSVAARPTPSPARQRLLRPSPPIRSRSETMGSINDRLNTPTGPTASSTPPPSGGSRAGSAGVQAVSPVNGGPRGLMPFATHLPVSGSTSNAESQPAIGSEASHRPDDEPRASSSLRIRGISWADQAPVPSAESRIEISGVGDASKEDQQSDNG